MVSIIIPVYNRETLAVRTLQSVAAQTLRPLEVVLVDNNSTDGTYGMLMKFKQQYDAPDFNVIVDRELTPGAAAARNRGAELSHGDWLLFFDSDDTMDPDMVECYMNVALDKNAEMVAGRGERINLDGSTGEKPFYTTDLLVNNIFHASMCPLQCCLVSRQLCERAGWWNVALPTWNDWDFSMRLLLQQPVVAFYDRDVKVHLHLQQESITGCNYASKAGTWECAIDAVEHSLRVASHLPYRERLLKFVEYRRMALSGLYLGEGRPDLAQPLYEAVCRRMRHDSCTLWLYKVLRRIVAAGFRGASHIVKLLVR